MIEIWVMDSECCSTCGALLDVGEWDQCNFCYENQRYDEEQAFYDRWFNFDEDEIEQEAGA